MDRILALAWDRLWSFCMLDLGGWVKAKRASQNIAINLWWWQQDNSVSLEIGGPKPWYPKYHLIPQGSASSSGCGLAPAWCCCCSYSERWSRCWTWRVSDYLVRTSSIPVESHRRISATARCCWYWKNEIVPNCRSSVVKCLLKWAVIWAGTRYPLIEKSKELLTGLWRTL